MYWAAYSIAAAGALLGAHASVCGLLRILHGLLGAAVVQALLQTARPALFNIVFPSALIFGDPSLHQSRQNYT